LFATIRGLPDVSEDNLAQVAAMVSAALLVSAVRPLAERSVHLPARTRFLPVTLLLVKLLSATREAVAMIRVLEIGLA